MSRSTILLLTLIVCFYAFLYFIFPEAAWTKYSLIPSATFIASAGLLIEYRANAAHLSNSNDASAIAAWGPRFSLLSWASILSAGLVVLDLLSFHKMANALSFIVIFMLVASFLLLRTTQEMVHNISTTAQSHAMQKQQITGKFDALLLALSGDEHHKDFAKLADDFRYCASSNSASLEIDMKLCDLLDQARQAGSNRNALHDSIKNTITMREHILRTSRSMT